MTTDTAAKSSVPIDRLSLDQALDRVSALEFAVANPFVNHGPMACEALVVLGYEDHLADWVGRFEASMTEAPGPVEPSWRGEAGWEDRVGDRRLLPEWLGYFQRAVAGEGWPEVIVRWVPRFMPALHAALFHGVIRTAHALRALEAADSPSRQAELARALAHWATWYGPGQPVDDRPRAAEPPLAAVAAAAAGARCFAAEPDIFHLHGVTGAMAVALLAARLPAASGAAAVAQLEAELAALYPTMASAGRQPSGEHFDEAARRAVTSGDPHQVKLVEACRRGFAADRDGAFLVAAEVATGLSRA